MINLWDSGAFWVVTVALYVLMVILLLFLPSRAVAQPETPSTLTKKQAVWRSALAPIKDHFGQLFDIILFGGTVSIIYSVANLLREKVHANVGAAFCILIPLVISGILLRNKFWRRA